jgi:cbb3-type cytochrome oxidase subunit 3
MIEIRAAFTVISLLTFLGIVWWAWHPTRKQATQRAVEDMMNDDDGNSQASRLSKARGRA